MQIYVSNSSGHRHFDGFHKFITDECVGIEYTSLIQVLKHLHINDVYHIVVIPLINNA